MDSVSAESALTKPSVAVVGFAEGHLGEAPYGDPEWEVWGINRLHTVQSTDDTRFDRWFNIHDLEKFHGQDQEHLAFLKGFHGPVYLRPQDVGKFDIPNAVPFPAEDLVQRFGGYFNNTISWLIAYAITLEPKRLGVFGVDMAQDSILNAEYCVSPDTRVLTADLRWVPAEQLEVGDKLVGFDEHVQPGKRFREFRETTVEAVTELLQPSFRLHMADGTKLISSDKHRWLHGTRIKWQTTNELHGPIMNGRLADTVRIASQHMSSRQIEQRYGIGRSTVQRVLAGTLDWTKCRRDTLYKVMETWDDDRSWDAGYLAAAFDGEGHLSMNPRLNNNTGYNVTLGFAQRDHPMADQWREAMQRRGFAFSSHDLKYQVKGGRKEMMRLLGTIRPPRLLSQFNPNHLGVMHKAEAVEILDKEFIGQAPVIGIQTTTGTFIAEGYASHNSQQRPSAEYFLGIASGLGIEVQLPKGSDLLKASHLYGFEDASPFMSKLLNRLQEVGQRKEKLKVELAQADAQINQVNAHKQNLVAAINQLDGAMQDVQYWLRNWMPQDAGDVLASPVVLEPEVIHADQTDHS